MLSFAYENSATIYFDFNEPIITNTVFHTVGRNFLEIVGWESISQASLKLSVFPNPTDEWVTIELSEVDHSDLFLIVTDLMGREMSRMPFEQQTLSWSVKTWPTGWYGLQVCTSNGQLIGRAKLVRH